MLSTHPRTIVGLLVVLLATARGASADVLYWDANGSGGGQTDGGGTWLAADQWWNPLANAGLGGNATWNNGTPDDAVVGNGGAGGTITLGSVTAGSITFNPFTGAYTLSGGSLGLNNGITVNGGAAAVTVSSPVTLGGNQTWLLNSASAFTVGGALTLGGNLTIGGAHTQAANFTGGLIFTGGNRQITFNDTGSVVLRGALTGGANTLAVGGTNTAVSLGDGSGIAWGAGKIAIGDGFTLKAGAANQINGALILPDVANSNFNLNGFDAVFGALSGGGTSGGNITNSGGAKTLTIGIDNASGTYSGVLQASTPANLKLAKVGSGMQTLTRAELYTGSTIVAGGTLRLDLDGAGAPAGNVLPATAAPILQGGTLSVSRTGAGSATFQTFAGVTYPIGSSTIEAKFDTAGAVLALGGSGIIGRNAGATLNFILPAQGSITAGYTNYQGLLNYSCFVGGTDYATVSGGQIVALNNSVSSNETAWTGAASNLSFDQDAATALTANRSFQTLRYIGNAAKTIDLGNYTLQLSSLLNATPYLVTVQNSGGTGSWVLTASGAAYPQFINTGAGGVTLNVPIVCTVTNHITKIGSGTLTLGGANTFAGAVYVNEGTVKLGVANALSASQSVALGASAGNTAALDLAGQNVTIGGLSTLAANGIAATGSNVVDNSVNGPVTLTVAGGGTFTGRFTASGGTNAKIALVKTGTSTLTLQNFSGADNALSSIDINGGTLAVGNGALYTSGLQMSPAQAQNVLGSAVINVNFGGILNIAGPSNGTQGTWASPGNAIAVNSGGLYYASNTPGAGFTVPGNVVFRSGAGLAGNGGTNNLTVTDAGASLPGAGFLVIGGGQTSGTAININGDWPLTGTFAFQGGNGAAVTVASQTIGTPMTLAFNTQTNATAFSGVTLGANLTVAGTGNTSLAGLVPQGSGGSLGAVAQSGGPRSITVNMAPIGQVGMTATAAGFTGGLFINGGTVSIDAGNTTGVKAGGAVALNGGGIRNTNAANNNSNWQDAFNIGNTGGRIESFSIGNYQDVTFSGAFTGSGPLTLRYGGSGSNSSSVLLAPTAASGFNGTIVLATSNGRGRVQFNANSLAGLSAGAVTVPGGVAFGVDALATLTGNIGKFSTAADSILVLDNLTGSNVDLSAAGINRDIRIGNRASITYTGTLTPNAASYNFTPGGGNTLTLGTANQLGGSNNLDVRAGTFAPGAYGNATGTLALTAAQGYSGTTTVSGAVRPALSGGSGTQSTTLSTSASLANTTGITLDNGGIFTLTGGTTGAAGVPIVVKGGGTLNVNAANALTASGTLTLGGASGGGTYASANAQSLLNLTVAAGNNTRSGAGILTLTGLAGSVYTRNAGGVVSFSALNTAFSNVPSGAGVSAGNAGDAILIGAIATTGPDFVKAASGTIAAPAYTTLTDVSQWGTAGNDGNILVNAVTTNTMAASPTINSLKIMQTNPALKIVGTLTVKSGMILCTNNGSTIANDAGGTGLTSGTNELIFHNNGSLTVSAPIVANAGNSITLTTLGTAATTLSNPNNAIADVYVLNGTLSVGAAGALGSTSPGAARTINLMGGTVESTHGGATSYNGNVSINVAPVGGNFIYTNDGNSLTVQGNVTLNGSMGVFGGNGPGKGTLALTGNIAGPGQIGFGHGGSSGTKFVLVLTGNNANWSGGIQKNNGLFGNGGSGYSYIRVAPAAAGTNSLGTGPIYANTAGFNGITFDTTAAGSTTFANDLVLNGTTPLVAWGLSTGLSAAGTANTTTLSGKIYGAAPLVFQGYATGDNAVSEMVLSGSVSMSGGAVLFSPSFGNNNLPYSYGNATTVQNFVNGQGGVTLGLTGRGGAFAATAAAQVDLPVGAAVNGAEGFVRFSGAQSFIPGAVGPGYIAALRVAGTGQDGRFGYLLTGGSTYALPEGKGFVIGSLGGGTQQYGTLGAAGGGTAILVGGNKHAPGQLLAGFGGGDVNVHANAAGDNQSLNLFARAAEDTLQIGTSAASVVFAPTYGDSGIATAITLMAKRTGTTTLNKVGAGTVEVQNAEFTHVDGSDARGSFAWNVDAGTLRWSQDDSAASALGGVNVNAGGNLAVSGSLKSALALNGGALTSGGFSTGTVLGTTSVLADSSVVDGGAGALRVGDISTSAAATLTVAADADLQARNVGGLGSTNVNGALTADSIVLDTLSIGAGGAVTIRETAGAAGAAANLNAVPEPAAWAALLTGGVCLWPLVRRPRKR